MSHGKKWRKLGRKNDHYDMLSRHLCCALFEHERIMTTEPKAKEFKSAADKYITMAKEPTLHHLRLLMSRLHNRKIVEKLLKELGPRFKNRPGGYTRILKMGGSRWEKMKHPGRYSYNRLGDNGVRVIWELVEKKEGVKPAKKDVKKEEGKEGETEKAKPKKKRAIGAGPK